MHPFNFICICLMYLLTGTTSENPGEPNKKTERCVFADLSDIRTVEEGVQAGFQCNSVNMGLEPKIWIEMDEQVFEPSSGRLTQWKFELRFDRTKNQHSLKCVCEDKNKNTKYSGPTVLNVQFKPTDISMMNHDPDVIENQTVTLSCTTSSSNPPSNIKWYEDGNLRPNNHDTVNKDGEYNGKITSLRYTTSAFHKHEHPEVLCCIDEVKTICRKWTAHVEYGPSKPTIRQDPDGIPKAGKDVTLTCSSDADPTPYGFITWFQGDSQRQGVHTGNHSKLYLPQISKDDAGPYHCEANNDIEEAKYSDVFNLKVYYSPEISSLQCSNDEETTTLQCIAQSLPNPVIQWFFPNGTKITDGVTESIISTDPFLGRTLQSDLTISVESSSFELGDFTCSASNSVSTNAKTISVSDNSCKDSGSITDVTTVVLSVGGSLVVIALFIIVIGVCRHEHPGGENVEDQPLVVDDDNRPGGHGTFQLREGADEQNIGPISGEYADGIDPNRPDEIENLVSDTDDDDEAKVHMMPVLMTDGGLFQDHDI